MRKLHACLVGLLVLAFMISGCGPEDTLFTGGAGNSSTSPGGGGTGGTAGTTTTATAGTGGAPCNPPSTVCGGECVDTTSDVLNCGACDSPCMPNASCDQSVCVCDLAFEDCGGACVDTQTDPNNCGACAVSCGMGGTCDGGACTACGGGLDLCGGECVDLQSNGNHCGICDNTCAGPCIDGACTQCAGAKPDLCNGICTDLTADLLNCGACDVQCASGASCNNGQCQCPAGQTVCDSACTDLSSDDANCGDCGIACDMGSSCSAGNCVCDPGFIQCATGCKDTSTDVNNCGACDKACAIGQPCSSGQCGACPMGEIVCGNACTNVTGDPANCGACGAACATGQPCNNGACGPCPMMQVVCNNACTDVSSDNANCGACGNICGPGATCGSGQCTCATGTYCGSVSGCVDTAVDMNNCGACGNACNPAGSCVGGMCMCPPDADGDGWGPCDGDCCDAVGGCASPTKVNPGAYEIVGNGVDDDCDPTTSDAMAPAACSSVSKFTTVTGDDVAKAMELCQFTTANPPLAQKKWGVISTAQLLANGNAPTMAQLTNMQNFQTAILVDYGTGGVVPQAGTTMAGISNGRMRDANDPNYAAPNPGSQLGVNSTPPAAWLAAHANAIPTGQSCGGANCGQGTGANDPVNVKLTIRVPTNAASFTYKFRLFTAEYATICGVYNDYHLALLTGTGAGIPMDKNIAHDLMGKDISANQVFYDVCTAKNCYMCPAGPGALNGTGLTATGGGGTLWLNAGANVVAGETITLELMVFDVSDQQFNTNVLLDAFAWVP